MLFDRVWSCLTKFEGHQTFKQQLKTSFFCSLVWWAIFSSFGQPRIKHFWGGHAYHACSAACMYDLCLIKLVLIVWPFTSTLACLVTKECLMVFGRQTFIVCPGPNALSVDSPAYHLCLKRIGQGPSHSSLFSDLAHEVHSVTSLAWLSPWIISHLMITTIFKFMAPLWY